MQVQMIGKNAAIFNFSVLAHKKVPLINLEFITVKWLFKVAKSMWVITVFF